MARWQGEIEKDVDEYNKRPRKMAISPRTKEVKYAQYVEDWRLKVERVGNLTIRKLPRENSLELCF